MRTAVLLIAVGFVGCAKPQPVGPEVVPAPRDIGGDPHRAARMESLRDSKDPILRDLARGHIKGGDAIEPLVKQNPHYDVIRFGDYVVMYWDLSKYDGTTLVGKGGTVRYAVTGSCTFREEFINTLSPEERTAYWNGHDAAWRWRTEARLALPAAVGAPAAHDFWKRPPLAWPEPAGDIPVPRER
ncbi:MAG: hypothetical protein C0501_20195 [Isosphaera sp.]|nr:hypothetical protein [Isosphaera sp.]